MGQRWRTVRWWSTGWTLAALAVVAVLGGGAALGQALRVGMSAPDLTGSPWINSAPLTIEGLRGRVVLVEFWTYG